MSDNRLQDIQNTTQATNVQTYSKFVKGMRLFLPITILCVIAVLILWPTLSQIQTEPLNKHDLQALKQAETTNTLLKPTFNTQDSKGRLVAIEAEEATQNKSNSGIIHLKSPAAQLDEGENALKINAHSGIYDQENKTIHLENNVTVQGQDGSTLKTEELHADITEGVAKSSSPATLTTDQATIQGQSVTIDQQGQTTTFQGPAKAVINP